VKSVPSSSFGHRICIHQACICGIEVGECIGGHSHVPMRVREAGYENEPPSVYRDAISGSRNWS
jgi:hypothetical protein